MRWPTWTADETTLNQDTESNEMIRTRLDNLNEIKQHTPGPIQKAAEGVSAGVLRPWQKPGSLTERTSHVWMLQAVSTQPGQRLNNLNSADLRLGKPSASSRSRAKLLGNWNTKSLKTHTGQAIIIAAGEPVAPAWMRASARDSGMRSFDAGLRSTEGNVNHGYENSNEGLSFTGLLEQSP